MDYRNYFKLSSTLMLLTINFHCIVFNLYNINNILKNRTHTSNHFFNTTTIEEIY